jgi:hypothetical protein
MAIFNLKTPVRNTILLYIIFILVLFITKPKLLFYEDFNNLHSVMKNNKNNNMKLKQFGIGYGKTLISLQIVSIMTVIVVYFFMSLISNIIDE